MTIRANTESKFLLKYLLIGICCLAFCLWATYDGFYKAPQQKPIVDAWYKIKTDESLNDAQRNEQYKTMAKEKGWPSKRPEKTPKELEQFVIWQYIYMGIGLLIGLPCILWYLKNKGTWIETKENGIRASWGQEVEYEQIREFDKKKWEKKGIGVLTYESKEGEQKFVLDDLKYSRKEMDEIVRLVESNIPAELIVNGAPEPIPGKPNPGDSNVSDQTVGKSDDHAMGEQS